ncbi:MAG: putative LPS assembly protein LptD [Paludibacteraceae bacterium]|nr:putative LPS assembly protein LptD [Paludibacteraceae bacterium]
MVTLSVHSQKTEKDSKSVAAKTTKKTTKQKNDSTSVKTKKQQKQSKIDAPVAYSANDSIVLSTSGDAYLFGSGKVNYNKLDLTADYIHLNTDSSVVSAHGTKKDTTGDIIGSPILKDNGEEYQAKNLRYNFVTKKGYILNGVVQQGEGYIIGTKTKKITEDIMCMKDGKYTTCPDHDSPHFYLDLTRAKVKQKKWVVTGPAYLVLLGVPLPIIIPFGYFPFNDSYSSGVIIPSYGDNLSRGYYFTNGGYYFAISDYMDLALTGDIYTKGSWAIRGASTYLKRYRFKGNFNLDYREDVTGMKEVPSGYSKLKNLSVTWTHTQDAKASPNQTLSASVNFSSSGYDRSNINNYYNAALLSQNTKSSSISYGYIFPNSPFSMTANLLANQRTQDSTISLTLPNVSVTMSRIYPFKRKDAIGKSKWFEKIYMSYNGSFSNYISTKEDLLWNSSLVSDWQNGMKHNVPIGASFNVLKYISITPTVNYTERWYLQSERNSWNSTTHKLDTNRVNGYYRVYDFNTGISASTKIYGFFTPLRAIFGDKIDRVRHVFTPTVSYTFNPDFSDSRWGSWSTYTDSLGRNVKYSPFKNGIYGTTSAGRSSSIGISLTNNLEMKVKHLNDTTGKPEYKTVSLIDAFTVSSSYNLAADSLNWADFNASLRLKILKDFTLNLTGVFDPYMYGLTSAGTPVQINKLRWNNGKLPRLKSTSTAFSYSLNNNTFKKKAVQPTTTNNSPAAANAPNNKAKKDTVNDNDGYEKLKLPWTLSLDYSLTYQYSDFDKDKMEYNRALAHNVGIRGTLNLTNKWSFNASTSYSFNEKVITYSSLGITRDLHCWQMSANVVPFGAYKSYNFLIQVKSTLLSDIKYQKQSDYSTPVNWY